MNLRVAPGLVAWVSLLTSTHACGPFFPDTVLDKPQAALGVPPVSFIAGLYRIDGRPVPPVTAFAGQSGLLAQIPLEVAELEAIWKKEGLGDDVIAGRSQHYREVRTSLLTGLDEIGMADFPIQHGAAAELPERPLDEGYPADVADYVEAARLHAVGMRDEARNLWKGILEKPAEARRHRSVWAAWMLAKTSTDRSECLEWYRRVVKEASSGANDVLKLAPAAKAWLAPGNEDPIAAIHDFHEAFVNGKVSVKVDLRHAAADLLENADPDQLAAAAADPLARRLLNLHLQAKFEQPRDGSFLEEEEEEEEWQPDPWLKALAAHAPLPLDDGARIAWALYATGHFEESRHWLELSDQREALTLWLQAKFALRAGNLEEANRFLSSAIHSMSADKDWRPFQTISASGDPDRTWTLEQFTQGRLLGDAGIVALARQDYTQALESLRQAGFAEDAAYLVERVLDTEELIHHVREHAPIWKAPRPIQKEAEEAGNETADEPRPINASNCLDPDIRGVWDEWLSPDNRLRWQLARRLAREGRFAEAGEFMPPGLKELWEHYLKLEAAGRDESLGPPARAAVLWRQARIHRHWGDKLFSTDAAPDWGILDWQFESTDLAGIRSLREGWAVNLESESDSAYSLPEFPHEQAFPAISPDELGRVARHPLPNQKRFHYRHVASEIAWKAASLLPDNDPNLLLLCNTAGQWLAARDPLAADRFYQAMVKRGKETELGKAADSKRWFLKDLDSLEDLPGLPEDLLPKKLPVD